METKRNLFEEWKDMDLPYDGYVDTENGELKNYIFFNNDDDTLVTVQEIQDYIEEDDSYRENLEADMEDLLDKYEDTDLVLLDLEYNWGMGGCLSDPTHLIESGKIVIDMYTYYIHYCKEDDMTFITKESYSGETVVDFHYGDDPRDTIYYIYNSIGK